MCVALRRPVWGDLLPQPQKAQTVPVPGAGWHMCPARREPSARKAVSTQQRQRKLRLRDVPCRAAPWAAPPQLTGVCGPLPGSYGRPPPGSPSEPLTTRRACRQEGPVLPCSDTRLRGLPRSEWGNAMCTGEGRTSVKQGHSRTGTGCPSPGTLGSWPQAGAALSPPSPQQLGLRQPRSAQGTTQRDPPHATCCLHPADRWPHTSAGGPPSPSSARPVTLRSLQM